MNTRANSTPAHQNFSPPVPQSVDRAMHCDSILSLVQIRPVRHQGLFFIRALCLSFLFLFGYSYFGYTPIAQAASCAGSAITGTIFRDYNADGLQASRSDALARRTRKIGIGVLVQLDGEIVDGIVEFLKTRDARGAINLFGKLMRSAPTSAAASSPSS